LIDFLKTKLNNYYNLKNNSIEVIEHTYKDFYNIKDPELQVIYSNHNHTNHINATNSSNKFNIESNQIKIKKELFYYLNASYLGPFNDTNSLEQIRTYLADVEHMYISYEFKTVIPLPYSKQKCFKWVNNELILLIN